MTVRKDWLDIHINRILTNLNTEEIKPVYLIILSGGYEAADLLKELFFV